MAKRGVFPRLYEFDVGEDDVDLYDKVLRDTHQKHDIKSWHRVEIPEPAARAWLRAVKDGRDGFSNKYFICVDKCRMDNTLTFIYLHDFTWVLFIVKFNRELPE